MPVSHSYLKRFFLFYFLPHSRGEKKALLLFQDKTSNSDGLPHTLPQALSITVPILAIQRVTAATTITALKYCYCYYRHYCCCCCCYQYYLLPSFRYSTPPSPATYPLLRRTHTSTYIHPTPSIYISYRNFCILSSNRCCYLCSIPYRHLFTRGGSLHLGQQERKDSLSIFFLFCLSILFTYYF